MKTRLLLAVILVFAPHAAMFAEDIGSSIDKMAKDLATGISKSGSKKISVIDFTDLQGRNNEFGRFVAEQLSVALVLSNQQFTVVDRANMKSILQEQKLTADGLVDPDNARKLGRFSGVDAIVLGSVTTFEQSISITAKVISTETTQILTASRVTVSRSRDLDSLLVPSLAIETRVAEGTNYVVGGNASPPMKAKRDATTTPVVEKMFGDLQLALLPIRIVNSNQLLLTIRISNLNMKRSRWVALSSDLGNNLKSSLFDSAGNEYGTYWNNISGIAFAALQHGGFFQATEINPKETITATLRFGSRTQRPVTEEGVYNLQLEFLSGDNFDRFVQNARVHNLVTKLTLESAVSP